MRDVSRSARSGRRRSLVQPSCPGLHRLCEWNTRAELERDREVEPCTLVELAFRPDMAAMRFDNAARDEQAEAGALHAGDFLDPESIEQVRQMVGWNAAPRVEHSELRVVAFAI